MMLFLLGQVVDKLKHKLWTFSVNLVGPVPAEVTHTLLAFPLVIGPRQAAGHECQPEPLSFFFPPAVRESLGFICCAQCCSRIVTCDIWSSCSGVTIQVTETSFCDVISQVSNGLLCSTHFQLFSVWLDAD